MMSPTVEPGGNKGWMCRLKASDESEGGVKNDTRYVNQVESLQEQNECFFQLKESKDQKSHRLEHGQFEKIIRSPTGET